MILITFTTLLILFIACCSSGNVDLCTIEKDKLWFIKDYNDHDLSSQSPVSRRLLRNADEEKRVIFSLYTVLNPTEPQVLTQDQTSLNNSHFDNRRATVFLIHGWLGDGNNTMNRLLINGRAVGYKDTIPKVIYRIIGHLKMTPLSAGSNVTAFLKNSTTNVIVVDWGYLASFNYITSSLAVAGVGDEVGMFIEWLTGFGLSYENVHIVGFSLGGHVAGCAGRKVGSRVRRITALDPAGLLWYNLPGRLSKADAEYVEVIHTNSRLFGMMEPCGDADFYPNGGASMPDCWVNMCSHSMAYAYMAESVLYNNMIAQSCKQLSNIKDDQCSGGSYPMGNSDLSKNISGLFRLNIISGRRGIDDHNVQYDKELCY